MGSVDKLKLLRGDDIRIDDTITIHQPSLDEITEFGELNFFNTFYSLCSIPSDMKSVLWDAGIDFMQLTDWSLFIMLTRNIGKDQTSIVFGDVDFSEMEIMKIHDTDKVVLVKDDLIITEELYENFIPYVREMIGYVMKREKAGNNFTKMILIDEDRRKRN